MIDLKAVKASGAFEIGRARALWEDGTLKLYTKRGMVRQYQASEPVRKTGWRRTWTVVTPQGVIELAGTCMLCGGWRQVTRIPARLLWES